MKIPMIKAPLGKCKGTFFWKIKKKCFRIPGDSISIAVTRSTIWGVNGNGEIFVGTSIQIEKDGKINFTWKDVSDSFTHSASLTKISANEWNFGCPNGWEDQQDECVKVQQGKKSWDDATDNCANQQAYLAGVHSSNRFDWFRKLITNKSNGISEIWFDGRERETLHRWEDHTGNTIPFKEFHSCVRNAPTHKSAPCSGKCLYTYVFKQQGRTYHRMKRGKCGTSSRSYVCERGKVPRTFNNSSRWELFKYLLQNCRIVDRHTPPK